MSADTAVPHRGEFPSWYPVLVTFVAVVLISGFCGWLASASSAELGALVTALLCVLLSVVAAALVRAVQLLWHYRRAAAAINATMITLAEETLPRLAARVRAGEAAEATTAELTQQMSPPHRRVVKALTTELAAAERARGAALATCATAAGRVQALTTGMLADLRQMQDRHSDADVLADLLTLDHSTAQAGRLADSIAVLTGARSGRRWSKPIGVESVLRGAMARVSDYRRIHADPGSGAGSAVVGYAAEGVIHALAEIMDNATRFSPPAEDVHVHVDESTAGLVITVEDGGLTMSESALARAEREVSAEPLDLSEVSGTRLGLAVVGCLVRKHELTVEFRASARGGTAVVLTIPPKLITEPRAEIPETTPNPADTIEARPVATDEPKRTEAETTCDELGALPKRKRGKTLDLRPARRGGAPADASAGARFGAFARNRGSSTSDDQPR